MAWLKGMLIAKQFVELLKCSLMVNFACTLRGCLYLRVLHHVAG